jgi:hypothetical protein
MRRVLLLFPALILCAQNGLMPSGFDGPVGAVPIGWHAYSPPTMAFQAKLTDQGCKSEKPCVVMTSEKPGGAQEFGNLMRSFDAAPYRGKHVRFHAAVRVEGARAQLWFRVDRPDRSMGFFDNMQDRPILTASWRDYEIVGDVDPDGQAIALGVIQFGAGKVMVDDVSLAILGDSITEAPEAARALTPRALDNEIAFAKLLGYVRHFHPSDQAAATDWDDFAIAGARSVENAADAAALAAKLTALFEPIAPTVRVMLTGTHVEVPAELRAGTKVTRWSHLGYGGNPQSIYHSERVTADVADGKVPKDYADPAKPFEANLGAGVSCLVPLSLYVDDSGTLPHISTPEKAPHPTRRTGDDRGTRLAGVMLAWNVLEHFYPYFDVVKTDWPAELRRALSDAAVAPGSKAYLVTLRKLAAALHDGHANAYATNGGGPAGTLPLTWDWVEGQLVITRVASTVKDVARGDVVLAIAGKPAAAALAETESLSSGATPQWIRSRSLREMTSCANTSTIALRIASGGDTAQLRDVTLDCSRALTPTQEERPGKIAELAPGILYIDLDRVTQEEWPAALPRLAEARGIVFDLRGYPKLSPNFLQHLSTEPLKSAQWHVPMVAWPDHRDFTYKDSNWTLTPEKPQFTSNRVFLTGGGAISYAESVMGIIEAYKLADIVGGPTAGTNGNINFIKLPGSYQIVFTGMKVLKHDGSQHHGVGIQPTVPVQRTRAGIAAGKDEVLDRGLELVKSRM